jgi:hypothetical protein
MTIYSGSRYEYSNIDFVSRSLDGAPYPIVFYATSSLNHVAYREHSYITGERLDQLAFQYYKDPSYWWAIVEFNPDLDFYNLSDGTVIRIPNV